MRLSGQSWGGSGMGSELIAGPLGSVLEVVDYVANGSFAALKENVEYRSGSGYAILVRLVDHNANWLGEKVFVDESAYRFLSKSALVAGDIIIANVGANAGTVFRVPELDRPATLGPNAVLVRPKKEIASAISKDFLYYYLTSPIGQSKLQSLITGSAQPKFNKTALRGLNVEFPPTHIQQPIADLMVALDARITLLCETNATLEAIAQALFKSWFVDFDPVRAKRDGRAPVGMDEATAALFPDGFEDSELGEVPRGWLASTLGECTAYLNRGISPKYVEEGGVVVLNQKCIRDFSVDPSKARRHDPSQRKVDGRELQPGDVLVNSTGVGTLGRVAQVVALEEPSIVDSHVTVVRANDRLTWNYLGLALMRMQPQIEQLGEGTTGQTELSRGKLAGVKVVVPPPSVLSRFDEAVIPLRMRVAANQAQAKSLASLRNTLLPRLISGQLRLPQATLSMEEALE